MSTSNQHDEDLQRIWDEVVDRIISRMLEIANPTIDTIHINLRGELILSLARLRVGLASDVARIRLAGRDTVEVAVKTERRECFDPTGLKRIESTAKNCAEAWLRRYEERWRPKSLAALEREKDPPPPKPRSPKRVEKNHYISRAFIKRYWAINGQIRRWRKDLSGEFSPCSPEPFGRWGHARSLYSDRLEDYFGLLEGDAMRPLEMLLASEPLNDPQREALVGFLIVQQLRNPVFVSTLQATMKPDVAEIVGEHRSEDSDYMQSVYETLYQNNEFYDRIARPVYWSTWVLLRCDDGFVLPDTWGVLCLEPASEVLYCAPLTPSVCFVGLAPAEREKRVLPISLAIGREQAAQINEILVRNCTHEFLSGLDFCNLGADIEPDVPIRDWIQQRVARITEATGEWT